MCVVLIAEIAFISRVLARERIFLNVCLSSSDILEKFPFGPDVGSIKTVLHQLEFSSSPISFNLTRDLEPLVKAMYRKLEPLFYVLTFQILHSSKRI